MAGDPMDELMGDGMGSLAGGGALGAIGPLVSEQVLRGLENLSGQALSLQDISFGAADPIGVELEFEEIPHAGTELLIAVPGGERFLGVLMVPTADLGGLLGIELDAAPLGAQHVAGVVRDLCDFLGTALFTGELAGIEMSPAETRLDDAVATVGIAIETAGGAALVRIDATFAMAGAESVRVVVLLPQAFLAALGELMAPTTEDMPGVSRDVPADSDESAPLPRRYATEAGDGHNLREAPADFGLHSNVSPLRGAAASDASADVDVHPVRFPSLGDMASDVARTSERRSLDLIMDVAMRVTVELGRSSLTVEEVLSLGPGSVVELNKLAGEPVDVLVNGQLVAHGEVVVVDENFGVRVAEIASPRRRAQAMGA